MKNTIFLALAAFFATATVNAQSTVDSISAKYKLLPMPQALTVERIFPVIGTYTLSVTPDATATTTDAATANTTTQDANTQTTDMATATAVPSVMITLDSASKGVVWIEGLPEGKFKAYLKQSPSTYRIISQKTEAGTQIPEGTLYFDTTAKVLNVVLGIPYNETEPTAVFMTTTTAATEDVNAEATTKSKSKAKAKNAKAKTKVVYYTATKVVPVAADAVAEPTEEPAQESSTEQQEQAGQDQTKEENQQ